MAISLTNLVRLLEDEFKSGKTKQAGREASGIAALKEALAQFGPGYGAGMEAKAKSAATAGAIGSGLGGTTRPAALSAGLSGEFEDMRRGRMAGALKDLGQFFGSYRDPYAVSAGDLTHAATGGFGGQLSRDIATEEANARIREQNRLNQYGGGGTPSDRFGGGGGYGGGSVPGNVWDETAFPDTIRMTQGPGGSFGGGAPPTGNLLGDFDPAAVNERLGNVLQGPGDAGITGDGGKIAPGEQGYMDWPTFISKYYPELAGKVMPSVEKSKEIQAEYSSKFG